jgi:acyl-CoA synthetase (AMP-forming)/AMP-acid ligase II
MAEFALAELFRTVAAEVPERECLVQGERRLLYHEVDARSDRLARVLDAHGLGLQRERAELAGWESGQGHVALYMYNRPEYMEAMLGCYKARAVPFNVNYRYVDAELIYLLRDARARGLVYEAGFAPTVQRIRAQLPELTLLLQLPDDSQEPLLPGAIDYETALAQVDDTRALPAPSPDDLYILYTGGTTGMPKGVLWRQADVYMAALGGRNGRGDETASLDKVRERARRGATRALPAPPMMHGAAHWVALHTFHGGGTVVMQNEVRRFDPEDVLATIARERVDNLLLVGDAFGRPLLAALESGKHDVSSLEMIVSSGAVLSASIKEALLAKLPRLVIVDSIGSSESGQQAVHLSSNESVQSGRFALTRSARVLSADLQRVLAPGQDELGWLAQRGRVPLGYLGDPDKTRRTFPVLEGVRYSVPGDRARLLPDGAVQLLGRDSVTINSGGEKVFAEEVEAALKLHPAVYDVLVCGRPSERWGQEVCAVVQLAAGAQASEAELLAEAARHLARYKLPKVVVLRDRIERSPSGKPDYVWARAQFATAKREHGDDA